MKRHAERHALSTLSELNVSPLIDLAFVLLIIFIISTPLLEQSLDVAVPASSSEDNAPAPRTTRFVSLDAQGRLFLQDEQLSSLRDLRERVRGILGEDPATPFVVRADHQLNVQHLVDLMDVLKDAGVQRLGIATRDAAQAGVPIQSQTADQPRE
jgi:biopolymer transport protein ExbD